MNQQVNDLREEGAELFAFLDTLNDDQWSLETPFKGRTVNWVVQHLHDADRWAVHSVTDPDGFREWRGRAGCGDSRKPEAVGRPAAAGPLALVLQSTLRCP